MSATSGINVSRRGFMLGAGAFSAMNAFGGSDAGNVASKGGREFKICLFADIHYSPGSFPHSTKEWLKTIMDHAIAEKCDFVMQLGDMVKPCAAMQHYIDYSQSFPIPIHHVLGNHDDGPTAEETFKRYGLERGYYHFDHGGFRFVALDLNYVYRGKTGAYEHYAAGNYFRYKKADGDKIGMISPDQLAWLKETIDGSPYPCIVFSHQSLERDGASASCPNRMEVQRIFNEANARNPGRVRMAVNGHHHKDYVRIKDNILYWDLNSANYEWVGDGRTAHSRYTAEWVAANKLKPRKSGKWPFVAWEYPIHSIVTLNAATGRIRSEGTEAEFSCGVTPESVGFDTDPGGRLITAKVQSFDLRIGV